MTTFTPVQPDTLPVSRSTASEAKSHRHNPQALCLTADIDRPIDRSDAFIRLVNIEKSTESTERRQLVVLLLGVLSVLIPVLPIGPFAWRSGQRLIERMKRRELDLTGRSAVIIGRNLGIIATFINVIIASSGAAYGMLAAARFVTSL